MNDNAVPASALLQVMNARFNQVDARLVAIEQRMGHQADQLEQVADRMEKAADGVEQANTILDRMIASMAGHTPEGRG